MFFCFECGWVRFPLLLCSNQSTHIPFTCNIQTTVTMSTNNSVARFRSTIEKEKQVVLASGRHDLVRTWGEWWTWDTGVDAVEPTNHQTNRQMMHPVTNQQQLKGNRGRNLSLQSLDTGVAATSRNGTSILLPIEESLSFCPVTNVVKSHSCHEADPSTINPNMKAL